MVNRVFLVESFVYRVEKEGYTPSEEEIRSIGEILGQPTKKLEVVLDRYWQVFTKNIEKKCSSLGSRSICIYTWRSNVPFKVYPLALHAFGTIILFEGDKPVNVLAYPFNKPLSYAKSPGISEEELRGKVPREVTVRVDGWHLTLYYNPLIERWVFATRYVLHNMYYVKGRLVEEPLDIIANPYVELADAKAKETGLYEAVDRYRGWTFTFVLEGPEPAITRPPYPIGADPSQYRLYLLMARDPEGRLYTWSETKRLLGYETPSLVEPREISELYREVRERLDVRSYIAFVDSGDPENPVLVELESDYYAEAMNAKHLNDAKSAAMLIAEGMLDKLLGLLSDQQAAVARELGKRVYELQEALITSTSHAPIEEVSRALVDAAREQGVRGLYYEEVAKALKEANVKRVVKKTLGLILEGKSLLSIDSIQPLDRLLESFKSRLQLKEQPPGSRGSLKGRRQQSSMVTG